MRLNKQQQQGKKVGSNCTSFSYSASAAAAAFAGNKCNLFYECPIYCNRHRWCIISVTAAEAQNKKPVLASGQREKEKVMLLAH